MSQLQTPPRWLSRFFAWLCKPADIDDLLGDMEEIYRDNLGQMSRSKARFKYFGQCWVLVFSYTVKKRKVQAAFMNQQWSIQNIKSMYFNYFKMVLRRFRTRLSFSLINIFGLGVGMAACFLITLFVVSEHSFDRFHEDYDRTYRLTKTYPAGQQQVQTAELRNYFLPIMQASNPAIESICRIRDQRDGVMVLSNESVVVEKQVAFAESNFFNFFSFPLLSGNPNTVLNEPYSVAISESLARKYFGNDQVEGQLMKVGFPQDGRQLDLKVAGVFKDMPANSHIHKDLIISGATGEAEAKAGRGFRAFVMQHNYFKLAAEMSIDLVNQQLPEIEDKHAPSFYKRVGMHLGTQAMADIHLRSNMEHEFEANSSEQYLDLLVILVIFILSMAVFNYTNLATSQSLDRSKEVGVRKVMGSGRKQLIARFMVESLIVSFAGLLLAAIILSLALPYFGQLSGRSLSFSFQEHWRLLLGFLGLTVLVGLLSGFYPALYMSGFRPIASLKGKLSGTGASVKFLRRTLVIGQFAISAGLMVGTAVVFKQFNYMLNQDLGLATKAIINVDISGQGANKKLDELKQSLLALPMVEQVAASAKAPLSDFDLGATNGIYLPNGSEAYSMNYLRVDRDFIGLYDIEMLVGQGYASFEGEPLSGVVLNRSAMENLGFNLENVVGQQVEVYDGYHPRVIGVTEDFHFESLRQAIGPVYFQWIADRPDRFDALSVRLKGNDLGEGLMAVQDIYKQIIQTSPFEYHFLDDRMKRAYENEQYFLNTFGLFSILAIAIASLGALGLAMQLAVSKQREMGVRKVLGAKVGSILKLMSKELIYMVVLANLIAWPVAYYFMDLWLAEFPYRDAIGAGVFLFTLGVSVLVSFLSIGGTSWRVAVSNPVKSLRTE